MTSFYLSPFFGANKKNKRENKEKEKTIQVAVSVAFRQLLKKN